MLVAETYLEAIATHLKLDIDDVRKLNLFKEGDETHFFQKVLDYHVPRLLEECRTSSAYEERKKAVAQFNKEHRFRKRGIALLPTTFGLAFGVKALNMGSAFVNIYMDGSVLVAHGGTEMGNGLYTSKSNPSRRAGTRADISIAIQSASKSRLRSSRSRSKPSSRARLRARRSPTPSPQLPVPVATWYVPLTTE